MKKTDLCRHSGPNKSKDRSPQGHSDSCRGRGQATLLDFVQSAVIQVIAIGVFLAVSFSFLTGVTAQNPSSQVAVDRAADRIADDLLRDSPDDPALSRDCTEAYFSRTTGICGFESDWSGTNYVQHSTGLETATGIHVAITDLDGNLASVDGTVLEVGDDRPTTANHDVRIWDRYVALDANGDGTDEWHRLRVYLWTS